MKKNLKHRSEFDQIATNLFKFIRSFDHQSVVKTTAAVAHTTETTAINTHADNNNNRKGDLLIISRIGIGIFWTKKISLPGLKKVA